MVAWERIVWVVLDSVGIGELPDAAEYGDVGRNTLGHVAESRPLKIPNLVRLGLANIAPLKHLQPAAAPLGAYGKGATRSPGKDTTTGHWEMAGVWLDQAFPVYKNGFPPDLIAEFERSIGRKTMGNKPVFGIGKIHDIYNGRGVQDYVTTKSNADGMEKLTAALQERKKGLIFGNLVDFDMLYGHRKDVEGFAKSLEEFDGLLTGLLPRLARTDLLMITADHGCDPDPRWETTDHSREYAPILAYSPAGPAGVNLGIRETLAEMGQTITPNFGAVIPHGTSFLREATESPTDEVASRGTVSGS